MSRREHAWIGGGLLLMIVATLFWLQDFLGDRTAPPGADSSTFSEWGWDWQSGRTNDYRLAFESRLSLGDRVLLQSIKGQLSVEVESLSRDEVRGDEVRLRAWLLDPELGGVLASEPELQPSLAQPFAVVLGKQGEFRQVLSRSASPRAMRLLEAMFESLTCELSPGSTAWQCQEIHLGSRVQAQYRNLGEAGIEKILQRSGMSKGNQAHLQSLEHKARYRPSETAAWLEFAHVQESATLLLPGGARAHSRMELMLRALPPGLAKNTPASPLPLAATWLDDSDALSAGQDLAPTIPRIAGVAERARLQALLDQLLSTEVLDASLLQQLESLLREYPELALLIPARVKPGISDQGSAQLLHLLELLGNPACQIALCKIASSPVQDRRERLRSLVALGGLRAPTTQSIAKLRDLSSWTMGSREDAATALLALGALGPRLTNRKSYVALKQGLAQRLLLSSDDDEGLCLLDALANTRDTSVTEAIATRLASPSPRLRRQAAMALAKIPGQRSEEHLLRILSTSRDSNLRIAAAHSLAERATILASTRSQALLRFQSEPDAEVRHGLATLLCRELLAHPELHAALTRALARERDDRVRTVLLRGLLRSPGGLPTK